jgi:hypothetical protein
MTSETILLSHLINIYTPFDLYYLSQIQVYLVLKYIKIYSYL